MMTREDFSKLIDERLETIKGTLVSKGEEYQRGADDVLYNFKRAAHITNGSKERALDGMMLKHYISYRDMLTDIEEGNIPSEAYVNEKIGDLINYFILMEGCIKERIYEKEAADDIPM